MENPVNEDQLQAKCFRWFDETFPAERKMLFAVPNGGLRNRQEANKFKATGVVPGVADMILVTRKVTFIEFKFGKGVQSEDQIMFAKGVSARGHEYRVIYSFEEFQKFIIRKLNDYER